MAKEFADDTDFSKLPEKKNKDIQELEESLTKLIEKHIPEHITKGQLMKMFEGSTKSAPAPAKVPTVKPGEKVKQLVRRTLLNLNLRKNQIQKLR